MRLHRIALPAIVAALLVFWGCEKQPPVATETGQTTSVILAVEPEAIALEAIGLSGWSVETEASGSLPPALAKTACGNFVVDFDRTSLGRGIIHYRFVVRTGPGPHDKIGLHRVVRESGHCRPVKSKDAIFLLHGDAKDFEGMFLLGLRSSNTPDDFGLAFFLADNGVDVWGIDQAWAIVPVGTTNFDFMKDWGLQRNVDDLLTGMKISRSMRFLTGNGHDRMILLGYSSGGVTGYVALGQESQRPLPTRQIRGFVCADMLVKTDDAAQRQSFVNDLSLYLPPYESGIFQADIPFRPVGQLARTDPDGASPIFPGFTNIQVALYFAAGQIFGPDVSTHYLAGLLDDTGFPIGLRLITLPQWLDFLEAGVPFEPNKFIIDYDQMIGETIDSPFDDHYGDIRVPIFNLAAKGGMGPYTLYGLTLLGSTDITSKIVEVGTGNVLTEFGHIDLFAAPEAQLLAWRPLLDWLKAHRH